jgi:hypothetical protein
MRKTELLGFLSDLEPSSKSKAWAWFVTQALQKRLPLFFGHYGLDSALYYRGDFLCDEVVANRVTLSGCREGLSFWYLPYSMVLAPKGTPGAEVFRCVLTSADFLDILQIALLREGTRDV